MTGCPGYLGITINDRLEQEELFHYDTVITCPQEFNITFNVPNWGVKQDKTFDIVFDDAKKLYRVFLTNLLFEDYAGNNIPMAKQTGGDDVTVEMKDSWFHVCLAIVCGMVLLLFGIYAYLERTRKSAIMKKKSEKFGHYEPKAKESSGCCHASRKMSSGQFLFVILYVVFKIIYSLLFTFTVFSTLIIICLQGDIDQVGQVSVAQGRQYNKSRDYQRSIEAYMEDELQRQTKMVTNMQGACNQYMEDLMGSILKQIENATSEESINYFVREKDSITKNMKERFQQFLSDYGLELEEFKEKYEGNFNAGIKTALSKHKKYLNKIYDNGWFQFPQILYNTTRVMDALPETKKAVERELSGDEVDFAKFLDQSWPTDNVHVTEQVQLIPVQFWER